MALHGGDRPTSKKPVGRPHRRLIVTIFYNSRMSPVFDLGVSFNLSASSIMRIIHVQWRRQDLLRGKGTKVIRKVPQNEYTVNTNTRDINVHTDVCLKLSQNNATIV